jgi:hypothetical protein
MDSSTKPDTSIGIRKDTEGIKRIVNQWAQRIYVVERRIELFHGEQELGEEAKTKNITGKDRWKSMSKRSPSTKPPVLEAKAVGQGTGPGKL